MRKLLNTASQLFDLSYPLQSGGKVGDALEQLLSTVELDTEPEWCPKKTPSTEKQSLVTPQQFFFYRPHFMEVMEDELAKAHKLQYALLPTQLPEYAPCRLSAVLESYCHLSGDIFGWHDLSGERLMLWLADMSGHGAKAGVLSALLRILIDDQKDIEDPGAFVTTLNRRMYEALHADDDVLYATGAFMVIESGMLRYVLAAHPPMLLRDGGGQPVRLDAGGRPVGVFRSSTYETAEVQLNDSAQLMMYTDGILEAGGESGEEFGIDRLAAAFAGSRGDASEVTRQVYDAISDHQDMRFIEDDVTLLAVEC